MWYLLDNDFANRHYVYVDTESVSDEQTFYKRLLSEVLRNDRIATSSKLVSGFLNGANRFFRKIKSIKVLSASVEFNHQEKERIYYEELVKYKLDEEYRKIIESLLYDGYLHYITQLEEYRFNSPVVRRWWMKFIC